MSNFRPPKGELKKIPVQQRMFTTAVGVGGGVAVSALVNTGLGILVFLLVSVGLNMYLTHRYNQGPTN